MASKTVERIAELRKDDMDRISHIYKMTGKIKDCAEDLVETPAHLISTLHPRVRATAAKAVREAMEDLKALDQFLTRGLGKEEKSA